MTKEEVIAILANIDYKNLRVIKEVYDFFKTEYPEFYNQCPNRKNIKETLELFKQYLEEHKDE